jgi:hypothetical protein
MSKPTETIVRIGTTVGKHTEAWGSAWVARRTVAEPCGSVAEGVPKGCRNVRDARNERTRGVGVNTHPYQVHDQ